MTETIVGRYNFEDRANKAALAQTITTGVTHYVRRDSATDTFIVYVNEG